MAVTFKSVGATFANDPVVTTPTTGAAVGDMLLGFVAGYDPSSNTPPWFDGNGTTTTAFTTNIGDVAVYPNTVLGARSRVATGSEASTYTLQATDTGSYGECGMIVRTSEATVQGVETFSGGLRVPAHTVDNDGSLLVGVFIGYSVAVNDATMVSNGWTQRVSLDSGFFRLYTKAANAGSFSEVNVSTDTLAVSMLVILAPVGGVAVTASLPASLGVAATAAKVGASSASTGLALSTAAAASKIANTDATLALNLGIGAAASKVVNVVATLPLTLALTSAASLPPPPSPWTPPPLGPVAFARAVAGSHQIAVRVDVLFNREVIHEGLPVVAGRVTFDRSAARLARLSGLTIADPLRVPVASDDILTPFGFEVAVWRGVNFGSSSELIPLGVFPIQKSAVDGVTLLSMIDGMDRSQLVSDARFEDVYFVPAGTNYADAVRDLLLDGVPDLEINFPSISFPTPALTLAAQDDRWEAAQKMARSCGMEILFDGLGVCTMRPEPTFTGTPDWEIAEAVNMVSVGVELDRGPAYNRVIATSNNASNGQVFRGVATDDNPASPTYYDGPFGRKPRFYSSEFIASQAQADSAAAAILASQLGVAKSVSFGVLPDPRMQVSDLALIRRQALGLDELHIIETLSIGLGAGDDMTGTTRVQAAA